MATAVLNAEEAYYLANSSYTQDWEVLSLSLPGTISNDTISSSDGWRIKIRNTNPRLYGGGVLVTDTRLPGFQITRHYPFDTTKWKGMKICYAGKTTTLANQLCQHISRRKTPNRVVGINNYYYF